MTDGKSYRGAASDPTANYFKNNFEIIRIIQN